MLHQDIRLPDHLEPKKSSDVVFVFEVIYKKSGVFKYPKVFQCDNGSEFKN